MSVDPDQLVKENDDLRAQITALRLKKARGDGTAQAVIASALECLDLLESGAGDDAERSTWCDMVRRTLQAEHDAYTR